MPHQVPQKIKLQFYMADSTEGNKKHYNSTTSTTSTIFNTFTLTVGFPDQPGARFTENLRKNPTFSLRFS